MDEIKRILIVQTAFLGDVILTTSLIKRLRGVFPDSSICFLLIPETKRLLDNNPHLNEVIIYDKRERKGVGAFLKILGQIKKRKFDLAIIPHRSLRSALLPYLGRIPESIGFDKSAGSFLFTRKVAYRSDIHEVERNLSLIFRFKPPPIDSSPELFPSADDLSFAREQLFDSGILEGDKIIAVAPGSVWTTKRWLPERFAKVSQLLMDRTGIKVVLLGSEQDRALCDQITNLIKEKPLNLAGKTDILQTAAVISLCSVVLSNDSAPVHLASAMKKPVVAIFGSTVPEFGFTPYKVPHLIIQRKLPCRPCGIHGKRKCPEKHFNCMREITAEEVFGAVMSLV
jgi:heptosyltransferase-2